MSPFRISLIFIVLTVVGFTSAFLLEVNFAPRTISNSFIISFSSDQNDPPLVTEQKVTSILEGTLSAIGGLKEIASVSRYGGGYITLSFEGDDDVQKKRLEILTALRQIRDQLPPNLPFPSIDLGTREDVEEPLLIYSLTSALPTNEIVDYANTQVIPQIGINPGIKSIQLSTDSRPAIIVSYDTEQLQSNDLKAEDIQNALYAAFRNEQIGTITSKGSTKSVFLNTLPEDITDLLHIQLTRQLRLGDLVAVKVEELSPSYISRLNGKNSILIRIFSHENENKPRLAASLKKSIDLVSQSLPQHMRLALSYDDTEFINQELTKISKRAGLSILILSALVLLVYRRWKQLAVLIGSVVVSIGISALVMYVLKIPVHLYTIAGLTISFGLVIDNSIMVIDHLRRKKDLKVITALLAATLTTIAALSVIFILPKEERIGMGDFAMAITIALCMSVIVSLLFTPAFTKVIGSQKVNASSAIRFKRRLVTLQQGYFNSLEFLARYKKILIVILILFFGLPVYMVPKTIDGFDLYNHSVGSDYYQEVIRPVSDKILGGMLRSFYLNVFESGGYRTPEKTQLYVSASLDEGHTIEQMDHIIRNVEHYLDGINGLDSYRTSIYSGKYAQVVIEFLEDTENGSLPYVLKNKLIQRSLDWGGVDWNVYGVGRGFSNAAGESLPSFRVKLKGYNYNDLKFLAEELSSKLLTHPRIKKVNTNDRISWRDANTEQLVLKPNASIPSEAYLASLNYINNAAPKAIPTYYITVGDGVQMPILYESRGAENFSIFRLQNESSGAPLSSATKLERTLKSNALYREDRTYVRVLSFEYYGSYRFGNEYLKKVLASYVFPPGYSHERVELNWNSEKTRRQYALIILILLMVFVICAATFESIRLPLSIILIIPLSFIGIFITFSWGEFYFDQGGYASFILLAGIVVNATIFIMVEAINYRSLNWNKSIIKACSVKFIPILLTIVSTCLGLIPFLIDGQKEVFWFSFAVGVIGGLLFSILLVFVMFPVLLFRRSS